MPWKNGKGETVEIAVFPPDASVSDFDWRISMAMVAEDGPFSVFDGIDRTLSILSGEGIELLVSGQAPAILRQKAAPHAFPADAVTSARLLADSVVDLNVMTRRGRFTHKVSRLSVEGEASITAACAVTLVFAAGQWQCGPEEILDRDTLLLERGDTCVLKAAEPANSLFLIEIQPCEPALYRA